MKKWRLAFLGLLAFNIAAVIGFFFLITTPAEDYSAYEAVKRDQIEGNSLMVRTTKADFEGIANKYIQKEMANSPIPLTLTVDEEVNLSTELVVFSQGLPILLKFDPFVQEDGNLLLKQQSVEIGMLDIPPESALKLLRDSVALPDFMEVNPAREEVLLKLTDIPLENGISVRATSFDLEKDDIRLQVTIQP
ncbi:YpmS family protein [Planococcus sp. N028]|uniref:YpmS family protein n=1 Tax=Planococcus shixiaomingii TaxID=3058393 RepID=A0ABT8MZG5_9BACL|nr:MULTISPECIES: YpmS family protein [unclassified Planococcus (in: firmicutes)]MDN7241032.1 YpmS family protein [Planococcus sp. N028]WKA53286.1 YpmS family protein [Planococcus sp. N022]